MAASWPVCATEPYASTALPQPQTGSVTRRSSTHVDARRCPTFWPEPATTTNTDDAVTFLELLRPGGPWTLSAIVPDGMIHTITVRKTDEVAAFVAQHNGKRNLYYSVNPTRIVLTNKASKVDIAAIEYLPGDLDPKPDETTEAAKARYLAALKGHEPKPAAIIDSGNGINILLKLAQRIELPGPVVFVNKKTGVTKDGYEKEALALIAEAESRAKALMENLGSVAGTQNIDRILRLPGTINLPNAKKRREGRVPCRARLIEFSGAVCKPEDFPAPLPPKPKMTATSNTTIDNEDDITLDWVKVYAHDGWLKSVKDLPPEFNVKARTIIEHKGTLDDLNRKLGQPKPYASWSEVSFALAAMFKIDGRLSHEEIAAALMCDLECNYHITKMDTNRSMQERAVERLLRRAGVRPTLEDGLPVIRVREVVGHGRSGRRGADYRRGAVLSARQQTRAAGGTGGAELWRQEHDGGAAGRGRAALSARHAVPAFALDQMERDLEKVAARAPACRSCPGAAQEVRRLDVSDLAGIIGTPTLRCDGTILKDAGYDPATQLLLIDPPPMPKISEQLTRDDALAALKLLKDLLVRVSIRNHDDNGGGVALGGVVGDNLDGMPRCLSSGAGAHCRCACGRDRQKLFAVDRQLDRHRAGDADARFRQAGGIGEATRHRSFEWAVADLHRQCGR